MESNAHPRATLAVAALAFLAAACGRDSQTEGPDVSDPPIDAQAEAFEQAQAIAAQAAEAERLNVAGMSFEEFEATVFKEPFDGGKYIVNGDTAIVDRKHLREFFAGLKEIDSMDPARRSPPPDAQALIVHQAGDLDAIWNDEHKLALTYCVSDAFGDRHAQVAVDMAAASDAWELAADVDLVHDVSQDADCTAANDQVVFDVRPVDVDGRYLARAFFPNEPRIFRNVLIDESSFELAPGGNLQMVGILRHELGHALGFRHEHTRPGSGACFEDADWRPLTDYDPFSVMHYPQCNGLGDWSLTLTERDRNGSACLYDPAEGFTIDTEICEPAVDDDVPPAEPVTETFAGESVAADEQKQYGPFAVAAGSLFEASIGGPTADGDPDLYVRYRAQPTLSRFNCRPFLWGAVESCAIDVPAEESSAFVMVHGFDAGSYDLTVTHTPPAE